MRADGLLCGVLCAMAVQHAPTMELLRRNRGAFTAALAGGLAIFVVLSAGSFETYSWQIAPFGYSLFALFFSVALLRVVAFPDSRLASALAAGPLRAAGLTSYFIYLFHEPVRYYLHWLFRSRAPEHYDWNGGLVTLLALVVTLALGALSWRIFESPLLRFARKFSYG